MPWKKSLPDSMKNRICELRGFRPKKKSGSKNTYRYGDVEKGFKEAD
jgi:hypothetical protein